MGSQLLHMDLRKEGEEVILLFIHGSFSSCTLEESKRLLYEQYMWRLVVNFFFVTYDLVFTLQVGIREIRC